MRSDSFINIDSYLEYIDYIQAVVAKYEKGNENRYLGIKEDMDTLIDKIKDDNLYLGVVGSFSSGKSTFINSVIHKNLLPTDAVQGTTVAASILKKADFNDLEIIYHDGKVLKFSEHEEVLRQKYEVSKSKEVDVPEKDSSFIKRLILWLKNLFGVQKKIKEEKQEVDIAACIEIFKKVVSIEELAIDVQKVTLYYQNENIPYKIAMVDTPGIESLNKRHNEVTKNAIDNICDAIVVIIPYDEPVSEELLDYINNNLSGHKSECIYVVTKIELLGDREEFPRLLRVIKRRLENGLLIENACVIPMPTLVYLKSVDFEMQTSFLDDISKTDRDELIEIYEEGIAKINELLKKNRNEYIKKKIVNICERVSVKLNDNLANVINECDEKKRILSAEMVKPLSEFEKLTNIEITNYCNVSKQRIRGDVALVRMQFSYLNSKIEQEIMECSDSQQLINQINFSCKETLEEIQKLINEKIYESKKGFNSKLKSMEKEFCKMYSKCGVFVNMELILENTRQIFNDAYISECEMLLQNEIIEIKAFIKNDTSGFFKKVKSFFSNPLSKHKDMALRNLLSIVEELNEKINAYVLEYVEREISDNEKKALGNLESMIKSNRDFIEKYSNGKINALKDNSRNRAETIAYIDRLNQYIEKIKGVN